MDRIKQREALFVCFLFLDYDGEQRIREENFIEMMNEFYSEEQIVVFFSIKIIKISLNKKSQKTFIIV